MKRNNLKRKSAIGIWILIIILISLVSIIGSFLFNWFWIIFLPVSFLAVIVFQAMSEHFWTAKKRCSRCNAPVSIYSEFCRNCGLQLIKKCPSCGKYAKRDTKTCENCNYKFPALIEDKKVFSFLIIQKGTPLPKKANFCPSCGINLIDEKTGLEFCPYCQEKID
jgi:predicted RNA-binding Zn-ribbon protein involved in translation (DUF1610 family)